MAERIRRFRWDGSPLGPVADWPQSLRSAVSICLASRFPIVLYWGPELVVLYNDAYAPILATKHPAALGRTCREVWAEIWDVIEPMLAGVRLSGEATWSDDQLLLLRRHGYSEECYFSFSFSPVRDETGRVGGIFTAVTETTPRVLGERRLRTLRDLGSQTTAGSVAGVLQSASEAIASNPADVPYALLYRLEAGSRVRLVAATGVSPPDRVREAELTSEEAWVAALARVRSTGAPTEAPPTRFLDAVPPSASPDRLLVHPIMSGTAVAGFMVAGVSRFLALAGGYRDFFDLVADRISTAIGTARAFEEERMRAESLAELDRAKTVFFSNVSHEFRTPLTLMLGPLEELRAAGGGASAEVRPQVELLHRNALRLLKLVNSLLDFARIEAGRAEAAYEATDLAPITAELAAMFQSAIERAGLRFVVDCPPLPEPVYVDRDMWEKIVLNLLSNALKFTFAGEIAVRMTWRGDHVALEIADTGTGIAAEEQPKLFQRFHRIHGARARTQEGSGIGLALVHELVRMHGGALDVDSAPGRGSVFRVRIPAGSGHLPTERIGPRRTLAPTNIGAVAYVEEALGWLPHAAAPLQPLGGPPPESGPAPARILVAEDNVDLREYLRRILSGRWDVQTVADGASALAAARATAPDLVLTDVMMPGLDGFELLHELRKDPRTSAIAVVMLSARAGEESRIEGLAAGADDYLVKPFSARELVARVSTQLAQAAVRKATAADRGRLYELFTQAPAPICVLRGPDLVYEMANPRHHRMVGRADLVGRRLLDVFPEVPGQGLDKLFRRVMETGLPQASPETLIRMDRRGQGDADETYWTFACAPLRTGDGPADRVTVLCTEITEQVRARRQTEAAREVAESASHAKDEFLAMLGHELRNPLAAIRNAIVVLEQLGATAPEVRELRSIIHRQAVHLSRLLDDLLDVSRVTAGKITLERQPVNLAEVADRCLAALRQTGRLEGRALAVHVEPVVVDGDPARLEQVLGNLLDNALKYTPGDGRIEVSVSESGGIAAIQVRDSGVGIPAEHLASIFEPFVQVRGSLDRTAGGLGLGLALVHRLVELSGGSVVARSDGPGRGSEFEVRLPAAPVAAPPVEPVRLARATTPQRRVLIVEDHGDARQGLRLVLELDGHLVEEAADGAEGLRKLLALRPEIALIDVGLPGLDGYALVQAARRAPECDAVLLVALTGYGQPDDRRRAMEAGFDAHLVKPVTEAALDAVLARSRRPDGAPPLSNPPETEASGPPVDRA
jgi:signal transduction histidine kinase/DNA-binding response OmpR family regulator